MLNILIAYPYFSNGMIPHLTELANEGRLRLFMDSGAFTAWKSGKPIMLDDYCRFIEELPFKPWRYLALDVIGDPEGTMKNYEVMLARGLNPVPIFTRGEDAAIIDKLYETSDIIAIGGLVGTQKNKGFTKGITHHLKGRPAHLLGFTNKAFIKVLRPYSCDSSSVQAAARYGQVELFNQRDGTWLKLLKADFSTRPADNVISLIKSYGANAASLAMKDNWVGLRSLGRTLSFRSHVRASLCYEKLLNVKYFLAINAIDQVVLTIDCYRKESGYDRMHSKDSVLLRAPGSEP